MSTAGLIADTHGLLRPEAARLLEGCSCILHAGDIGKPEVIDALRRIAPVHVVRGNVDRGAWARDYPDRLEVDLDGVRILMVHDENTLDDPGQARVVVSGHSHRPLVRDEGDVLYVNPGSAGPRRFRLPVSLGYLEIDGEAASARLVDIGL